MTSITSALQVWHPEFSAEKIQDILNISPQISYSVGDEIVRPNGEKLGKKHRTSYLCYDMLPPVSLIILKRSLFFMLHEIKSLHFSMVPSKSNSDCNGRIS